MHGQLAAVPWRRLRVASRAACALASLTTDVMTVWATTQAERPATPLCVLA